MLGSLFGIVKDVANVALTPAEIVVDVTRAATKPISDACNEVKEDVKEGLDIED